MKDIIFEECYRHFNDIVAIRRDIHQHPELRFDVERTAGIAADSLEALGISVKTGVGKTGVVGDLEVSGAPKRIALRADMDALPIQEQTDVPYKSKLMAKLIYVDTMHTLQCSSAQPEFYRISKVDLRQIFDLSSNLVKKRTLVVRKQ